MPPFMSWLSNNIPAVYDNTMTYYEELVALIKYLEDIVVPAVNHNAEALTTVSTALEQLKQYVDNYFANLDVQEEINNKLDQMADDGTLQEIVSAYLDASVTWTFDTVADMKLATNLIDGSYARTLGFYTINDGGGATYKISDIGTANEMDVIAVGDLYANLCVSNQSVYIAQLGAKGDGTTDETNILSYALADTNASVYKKIYLNGNYLISSTLNIASDKDVIGVKNDLQFNTASDSCITTNSDIKMINIDSKTNITIENINLIHPVANTSTVVDFSKSRYVTFKNIQVYHEGTTKANCIAFDDTINQSSSGFSGYIVFENVKASYYDISVKSKATFITFKGCVFNQANTVNIYFLGEVCGIDSCDISHSTSGKAVKTESIYDMDITNSYLEGFYIDRCFEKINNININLRGSKIYIPTGVVSAEGRKMLFEGETYPQPLRNTLNSYQDGRATLVNLVPNGQFDKGLFGWTASNANVTVEDATSLSPIELPHYMTHAVKLNNANIITNINEKLNVGDYITIGYWVYRPSSSTGTMYVAVLDQSNQNAIVDDRPTETDKWVYHTSYAKITSALTNGFRIRITFGSVAYLTGITLMKGHGTSISAGYTPNDTNIVTDNLIIKGSDDKYYKLATDGTTLTFTEVTSL